MSKRDPLSYHDTDLSALNYRLDHPQDLQQALDTVNEIALLDEQTDCIKFPRGDPETYARTIARLEQAAQGAVNHDKHVISFDIDLTLHIGEEFDDDFNLVDPSTILELQKLGHIVGTTSDRTPTDQRDTMRALGLEPDFCIPKEMLTWTKQLLPGKTHTHVGDDPKRDRDIATEAGWQHLWPHQYDPNTH